MAAGSAPQFRIYPFKQGNSDGDKGMVELLGEKGANLCEMARHNAFNVPPGFTITTEVCEDFYRNGKQLSSDVLDEIRKAVRDVAAATGCQFGDSKKPLLLAVRSSPAVPMPGVMGAVLNLGLNDLVVNSLATQHGAPFAYDCYRRLLQLFGEHVLGIPREEFEMRRREIASARGIKNDIQMSSEDLRILVAEYKALYEKYDKALPQDPWQQLDLAISAIFMSWNDGGAVKYRQAHPRISSGLKGTAVIVQAMVYGNLNDNSGAGVCFSRNPLDGDPGFITRFLIQAQGTDLLAAMSTGGKGPTGESLNGGGHTPISTQLMANKMTSIYEQLVDAKSKLERLFKDLLKVEFAVQNDKLSLLACVASRRSGSAAIRVTVDMDMEVEDPVVKSEAVRLLEHRYLDVLLIPPQSGTTANNTLTTTVLEADAGDKDAALDLAILRCLREPPGFEVGGPVFTTEDIDKLNAWWVDKNHRLAQQVSELRAQASSSSLCDEPAISGTRYSTFQSSSALMYESTQQLTTTTTAQGCYGTELRWSMVDESSTSAQCKASLLDDLRADRDRLRRENHELSDKLQEANERLALLECEKVKARELMSRMKAAEESDRQAKAKCASEKDELRALIRQLSEERDKLAGDMEQLGKKHKEDLLKLQEQAGDLRRTNLQLKEEIRTWQWKTEKFREQLEGADDDKARLLKEVVKLQADMREEQASRLELKQKFKYTEASTAEVQSTLAAAQERMRQQEVQLQALFNEGERRATVLERLRDDRQAAVDEAQQLRLQLQLSAPKPPPETETQLITTLRMQMRMAQDSERVTKEECEASIKKVKEERTALVMELEALIKQLRAERDALQEMVNKLKMKAKDGARNALWILEHITEELSQALEEVRKLAEPEQEVRAL